MLLMKPMLGCPSCIRSLAHLISASPTMMQACMTLLEPHFLQAAALSHSRWCFQRFRWRQATSRYNVTSLCVEEQGTLAAVIHVNKPYRHQCCTAYMSSIPETPMQIDGDLAVIEQQYKVHQDTALHRTASDMDSFTHSFIRSFIHSCIHSFVYSLIHSMNCRN